MGADLEVIIQSRREVPEDIRDAIHRGAYYYLTKPYEWPQLRALIQAAESSRELKRSLKRRVSEIQNIVRLLDTATFELRSFEEAEIVAAHLGAAAGDPQLGIGILELLLNGIEHGNLGITYEDKSALLEAGHYEREVAKRLAAEDQRDKWVTVVLKRVEEHLEILISDRGSGFDYESYLAFDQGRIFDSHGRGVASVGPYREAEVMTETSSKTRDGLRLVQLLAQARILALELGDPTGRGGGVLLPAQRRDAADLPPRGSEGRESRLRPSVGGEPSPATASR